MPDELIPFVSPFSFSFSDESDYMVWEPTSSGLFTLHSAYNLLRPKQASLPSMRFVWSKRVPTKISFFAWRLLNGLLPFADILVSLGFHFPSKCPSCASAETLAHGFVGCLVARQLWSWISAVFAVEVNCGGSLHLLLHSFWGQVDSYFSKELLEQLPLFVFWILWKHRNHCLYDASGHAGFGLYHLKHLLQQVSFISPLKLTGPAPRGLEFIRFRHLRRRVQVVFWSPSFSSFKMNVDGASVVVETR